MINWSTVDKIYRRLLLTQFFTKGWGKPETIKRIFEFGKILVDRPKCLALINEGYPVKILRNEEHSKYRILEGTFVSPFAYYLPDLVPDEVKTARFEMVVPSVWASEDYKPVCIHLAGTGDHGFWRRRVFTAKPLIKEYGIGSLSLENPYYGYRKPKDQLRSALHNVSDLFVMGGSLMLESIVLLQWLEKNGYGPLGLSGVSMGGHMATLACTVWDKPIPLIPCLSWSSATPVFTKGAMSRSIPWDLLRTQYINHSEYEQEIMKQLLKCPKTDSFRLGRDFAINFPDSYKELKEFSARFKKVSKMTHNEASASPDHENTPPPDNPTNQDGPFHNECNATDPSIKYTTKETRHNYATKAKLDQHHLCNYNKQSTSCCLCSGESLNRGGCHLANSYAVSSNKLSTHQQNDTNQKKNISGNVKDKLERNKIDLQHEADNFMRGVMDVTTFIGNFSVPVDPQMVISVLATQDAYIPRDGVPSLDNIWPGIEMRYVSGSHVTAALFKQYYFRQAINDAFQKYLKKYPSHQERRGEIM